MTLHEQVNRNSYYSPSPISQEFSTGAREVRLYALYKRPWLRRSLYAAYFAYLALALFERPAQPHLRAPFWATVTVEFLCVCAFLCRLFHELLFSAGGPRRFWADRKHAAQAGMLALILVGRVPLENQQKNQCFQSQHFTLIHF